MRRLFRTGAMASAARKPGTISTAGTRTMMARSCLSTYTMTKLNIVAERPDTKPRFAKAVGSVQACVKP